MDYLRAEKTRLQKELKSKRYLSDLDYWGIKSRDVDEVIKALLELDLAGKDEIHDFPIWTIMEAEENQRYLNSIFPKLIKKIKGPKLSIKVDYGGKSMYNFFLLADMLTEDAIPDLLDTISDEIAFLTDDSFWYIACTEEEDGHQKAKKLLLDFTSGLEKRKIVQKLKFAASVVGRKIVDKALVLSDNLTIKEMEAAIKGQPEFLSSYYENAELSCNF